MIQKFIWKSKGPGTVKNFEEWGKGVCLTTFIDLLQGIIIKTEVLMQGEANRQEEQNDPGVDSYIYGTWNITEDTANR